MRAPTPIAKVVLNKVYAMTEAFLVDGRSEPFNEGALNNPEINRLMRRR